MRRGIIPDTDKLSDYFHQVGAIRWNIYNGIFAGALPQSNCLYRQDNKTMDQAESWALLLHMIELNSANGADFTIYFPTNPNGNMGNRVYLSIGQNQAGQVAGIGNIPGMGAADMSQRINDAVEVAMLRRDVEDLMQLQKPEGFWGIMLEKLAENPNVGDAMIGAFSNLCTVAAAKISGTPIQMQHPGVNGPPAATTSVESDIEIPEDSAQRCNVALERIAPHFPDLAGFLEGLANYIENDPQTAKTMFAQMAKK